MYPSGKPNVLVTGGAGFIGSYLCQMLLKQGKNVVCVDNFISGFEENIELLLQNPSFEFIKHDLIEPLAFSQFPELKKFEIDVQGVQEIYHLACPTSPKDYKKFPIETLLANAYATRNALELARENEARFLFASSSVIYGNPAYFNGEPIPEKEYGPSDPLSPRSPYNQGKRFAESLVKAYADTYGVSVRIARIFRTYGPRMRINDGRMTPDWIRAALHNEPIVMYASPETKTSFCFVSDIVDGLLKLMESDISDPVNFGSLEPVTFQQIAEAIIRLTGSASVVSVEDPPPSFELEGIPNIDAARVHVGWLPMVPLETGLKETIKDMEIHSHFYGIDRAKIGQE